MDAATFLGLQATHNPRRWVLPVTDGICGGTGRLFGGCGLGAATAVRPRWRSAELASQTSMVQLRD